MQLKDFVKNSINEIVDGVAEAQKYCHKKGAIINPDLLDKEEQIEFDVLVTEDKGTETSGGISVLLGSIGLATKGKSSEQITQGNRIKFKVGVMFPKI